MYLYLYTVSVIVSISVYLVKVLYRVDIGGIRSIPSIATIALDLDFDLDFDLDLLR